MLKLMTHRCRGLFRAIRGCHLQNGEAYCVILNQGAALADSDVAALPSAKRACD